MMLLSSHYIVVQILLLVVLLGAMIYFFLRYTRTQKKIVEYLKVLESMANNHASLAREFERNLTERREIIKELLRLLDERIDTAKRLVERLEEISEKTMPSERDALGSLPINPEHEKIVRLARKGLSARRIAQHFQKPLGEVELILGLYGIPTSDEPSGDS